MNGQASVHSIAALEEFKAALIKFMTEMRESLSVTDMQVRRGLDWFQHDLLKDWQSEVRKREDAVTDARVDLERCRMQKFGDRTPDCTDQRVALKKAQARLEEAEQKVKAVKKWSKVLQDEAEEFLGLSQELSNVLAGETPKGAHDLKRMIDALYAYIQTTAPSGAVGMGGDASAGPTMARAGASPLETPPLDSPAEAAAEPAVVGGEAPTEGRQ
jgi:hypothetical protein